MWFTLPARPTVDDVAEYLIGEVADFDDGRRRIVTIEGTPVGVFAHGGDFYAYRNSCPHQGGPVCEGLIMGRVEEEVDELGRVGRGRFSADVIHLVCPWHGMEFELRSGVSWSDPRRRLISYQVIERAGQIFVRT